MPPHLYFAFWPADAKAVPPGVETACAMPSMTTSHCSEVAMLMGAMRLGLRGTTVFEPAARMAETSRGLAITCPRSAISAAKCACCRGVAVIAPWPMPMLTVSPANQA